MDYEHTASILLVWEVYNLMVASVHCSYKHMV